MSKDHSREPSSKIKEACFWVGGAEITYADGTKEIHRTDRLHEHLLNELKASRPAPMTAAQGWVSVPRELIGKVTNSAIASFSKHPGNQPRHTDWQRCVICKAEWTATSGTHLHGEKCPIDSLMKLLSALPNPMTAEQGWVSVPRERVGLILKALERHKQHLVKMDADRDHGIMTSLRYEAIDQIDELVAMLSALPNPPEGKQSEQ